MSWKTNRETYVVLKPNLYQHVGEELNRGLVVYHRWCDQHLTVRNTTIAILFAAFGMFGIYAINLPLYLLALNDIRYFSIYDCWKVICMVSIWTIHLYFNALHFNLVHSAYSHSWLSRKFRFHFASWRTLLPFISYPFATLCCTSFYFAWIGETVLSSLHSRPSSIASSNDNTTNNTHDADHDTNIMIQYSILLLSYLYGYIPHEWRHGNAIAFSTVQPRRLLFFKQIVLRILVSNTVQTTAYCLGSVCMWWCIHLFVTDCSLSLASSWRIFSVLFRITFNLNYLWLLGYLIMNRILTEKTDLSRWNGAQFPLIENPSNVLSRNTDCRLLAFTQSHLPEVQQPIRREYFYHLALIELLDLVQYDGKQRRAIYATQIYYNIIVETLLAEYTSFVTTLYEYLFGDNNPHQMRLRHEQQTASSYMSQIQRMNVLSQQSFVGAWWFKVFTLRPEIASIFRNYQTLIYAADILSFLIVHSLEEDELGIVQESLEQILCVLLECLDILDLFLKSKIYREVYAANGYQSGKNEVINALYKGIETALMRVVVAMHSFLGELKLPQKNAQRLQSYLVEC